MGLKFEALVISAGTFALRRILLLFPAHYLKKLAGWDHIETSMTIF